ncbi:MAG TPA: arginine repressor [Methylomusa anaerophila]|uniref:Arginine repressor n=1 Tax=Methylomusa anaerophila TaxID=1930071 RepID=A0A348APD0_9FIRM|nr:arginine repressor [Methylomusa anaerophila]BBB92928.1 arginine repressor [Methylomusa anaerophila]HML87237.1 arginine repressor [Methylomusa anaerophila]
MKGLRHAKIKEIVERHAIETQEELADALRKQGIEVTQATVSRDIKELMLTKVPTGEGRYRYSSPPEHNIMLSQSRLERTFQDSVIAIDHSLNIVVLRTVQGMAPAVAYTIDYVKWPEIIGTVAGEDTIFVLVKPAEAALDIVKKFQSLMQ